MRKGTKTILIILISIIGIILIDTIQAKIFNNKPILKIVENYNGGNLYQKNIGIIVDNYIYTDGNSKTFFKWENK